MSEKIIGYQGKVSAMNKPSLVSLAAALGLDENGTKAVLIPRIESHLKEHHDTLARTPRFAGLYVYSNAKQGNPRKTSGDRATEDAAQHKDDINKVPTGYVIKSSRCLSLFYIKYTSPSVNKALLEKRLATDPPGMELPRGILKVPKPPRKTVQFRSRKYMIRLNVAQKNLKQLVLNSGSWQQK